MADFEQKHIKGKVWVIRRYDSWYPVEKTPQGNFAFLHGSGRGSVNGTKADAIRFARQALKGSSSNPRKRTTRRFRKSVGQEHSASIEESASKFRKWTKVKAIKVNKNGSISLKK